MNIEMGILQQIGTSAIGRLLLHCAAVCGVLLIGVLPAAAETWNDNYSNTVTSTGVTTSFPDHEKHIPGDVIASKMKDKASAEEVWASQGGKVIDYQGSVNSGKIKVVVDFGYIKDTHEYVRE
jgi:hypothetical protein